MPRFLYKRGNNAKNKKTKFEQNAQNHFDKNAAMKQKIQREKAIEECSKQLEEQRNATR